MPSLSKTVTKRPVTRISLILATMLVLLVGCNNAKPAATLTPTPRSDFKVGLILNAEGPLRDGTFSESAYNGVKHAGGEYGLDFAYKETVEDKEYPTAIDAMIKEGRNIIITMGFQMNDATIAAAKANPKLFFIGVDQSVENPPANFVGLLFREDQGGFLAGALAGMTTKSNVVGVVGGVNIPPVQRYVDGFVNGAKFVNPKVTALQVYTKSFADVQSGRTEADKMLAQNADVIFGAGGLTGSSAIVRAAEQGKLVIGVDQDEFLTTFVTGDNADKLLSSATKGVDLGIYRVIGSILKGDFKGGALTLSAAECGILYAPFHKAGDTLDATVKTRIEAIWRGLAGGTLTTGVDKEAMPEALAAGASPKVADTAPKLSDCGR